MNPISSLETGDACQIANDSITLELNISIRVKINNKKYADVICIVKKMLGRRVQEQKFITLSERNN